MIDLISNSVVFECKGFKSAYMHLCHLNIDLNNFGFFSMNYTNFMLRKLRVNYPGYRGILIKFL